MSAYVTYFVEILCGTTFLVLKRGVDESRVWFPSTAAQRGCSGRIKYTPSLDYGTLSPNLFGIVRQGIPKGNPAVLDYDFSISVPATDRASESTKVEMP